MSNISDLITTVIDWIDSLIPVVFGLAVVFFLWGLVKFMFHAGDEKSHEEGRRIMVWGVIILFVMMTFWGIIAFLQETFDLTFGPSVSVPTAPTLIPPGP